MASGPALVVDGIAIYERFASGGMATVHVGLTPDGSIVAVKRLHAHLRGEESFVAMLLDEARLAQSVDHPNVVRVLDVIATPEELLLVMEYVHGLSLSRLTKRAGPVPLGVALAIMRGVLSALDAAHTASGAAGHLEMVHRDVSPQNIIVGSDGSPKLTDFGIAKAVGRLRSTTGDNIKGKLAYMSPEQAAGERLDARTDIYSAGVVLWELVVGRPLFDGPTEGALFGKVLQGAVVRLKDVLPTVPDELDEIVARALARDPRRRFRSARLFAEALSGLRPVADPDTVSAWVGQHGGTELEERAASIAGILDDRTLGTELRTTLAPRSVATRPPIERRPAWRWGAVAFVVFATGVGAYLSLQRPASLGTTVPEPSGSEANGGAFASRSASPELPVDAAAPSLSPSTSASTHHDPTPKPPTRSKSVVRKPDPRGNCDLPYTVGNDGIKRFKPECVK